MSENKKNKKLSKLERRRRKRQRKKEKKRKKRKKRELKKKALWVVGIAVIVGLVAGIIVVNQLNAPDSTDYSQTYPSQGQDHIDPNGIPSMDYNSNPPTSGDHYADWVQESVLENEVADQYLIHNLEHGQVWISYHPDRVSEEVIEQLEDFGGSWVVVGPRNGNDSDIALAAWTRLDTFDLTNGTLTPELETRIEDFIDRYQNKAPESIPLGAPMAPSL